MIVDGYQLLIIDGSLEDYFQDELVQAISYDGLQANEADSICRLSLDRGFTCVLRRKKFWIKDGEKDVTPESGSKL